MILMSIPAILLSLVIIFVIGSLFFSFEMQRVKGRLFQLASQFGGRLKNPFFLGPLILEGCYSANQFRIYIFSPDEGGSSRIVIELSKDCLFSLRIIKKTKLLRLKKKLGLFYKEIQMGIPEFDDKFYISTTDKIMARNYVSNDAVRSAIYQLFDNGWQKLYIDNEGINIEIILSSSPWGIVLTDGLEQEKIIKILENLLVLSKHFI